MNLSKNPFFPPHHLHPHFLFLLPLLTVLFATSLLFSTAAETEAQKAPALPTQQNNSTQSPPPLPNNANYPPPTTSVPQPAEYYDRNATAGQENSQPTHPHPHQQHQQQQKQQTLPQQAPASEQGKQTRPISLPLPYPHQQYRGDSDETENYHNNNHNNYDGYGHGEYGSDSEEEEKEGEEGYYGNHRNYERHYNGYGSSSNEEREGGHEGYYPSYPGDGYDAYKKEDYKNGEGKGKKKKQQQQHHKKTEEKKSNVGNNNYNYHYTSPWTMEHHERHSYDSHYCSVHGSFSLAHNIRYDYLNKRSNNGTEYSKQYRERGNAYQPRYHTRQFCRYTAANSPKACQFCCKVVARSANTSPDEIVSAIFAFDPTYPSANGAGIGGDGDVAAGYSSASSSSPSPAIFQCVCCAPKQKY